MKEWLSCRKNCMGNRHAPTKMTPKPQAALHAQLSGAVHHHWGIFNHRHDFSSQSSWRTWVAILLKTFHGGDSPSNTPVVKDEPAMANVGSTVESPVSTPNHIIANLDSDTDTGSPPEEGTPGREVTVQNAEPLSFSYMHSEREHSGGVASLSRSGSSIRRRQISME